MTIKTDNITNECERISWKHITIQQLFWSDSHTHVVLFTIVVSRAHDRLRCDEHVVMSLGAIGS